MFGVQVDRIAIVPAYGQDNKATLKGAWLRHRTRFKFWGFCSHDPFLYA